MQKKKATSKKAKTVKKIAPVVKPVIAPPVVVKVPESESSKIWNEIKDKEIFMFALPSQKVSDYCKPVTVEPSKLYLLTTASSVLPSLEAAIGRNYVVEVLDKYTVVSRVPSLPFKR